MGAYGKYMFNQELITWSIDGGGAVFYRRKHRFSVTNVSGYIAVNPEKINCKFLAYAMSLAHSRIKFDYTVKAHPSVIRSLYTMGIPISLQEQQVIGSFFSRLDNLITLHQRKYDKLVVFKKSMLEKMFPKDGESVPEIRFAGFTDPWEQRKFSELASLRRGLTYSPADIRPYGQGIRVLRSSNIDEDEFTLSNEDVFVDETVVGIELVQEGEILITAANGSPRLVGKRAIINGLTGKTVHGGFMLCAHAEQPDYVAALMGSRWYQHFLATGVAGGNGSIGNLDKAALEDEFAFVPSIEEQELIGVLFSRLDDLITLHQRKLELLQNIKKSLLDKMFV